MNLLQKIASSLQKKTNPLIEAMTPSFAYTGGAIQPQDFSKQVQAYRSWVYACVTKIAPAVASAKLKLFVKRSKEVEELTEHPFLDLMKNVNPFMNKFDLKEGTSIFLLLTGNNYWFPYLDNLKVPKELWIIPTQNIRIVPDDKKFIKGYIYKRGLKEFFVEEKGIIHHKLFSPSNAFYGMGPLAAAAYEYDTSKYMQDYEIALFKNQARPDYAFITDQSLTSEDTKKLRKELYHLYGGVSRAGRFGIFQKSLQPKELNFSPKEVSYLKGHNRTRDAIAAIFGVPKGFLTTDDVNRANMEASEYIFAKYTIQPFLIRLQEKINEKLMPLYPQKNGAVLYCEFENVVPQDKEFILKEREVNIKTGFAPIDEERGLAGRDPLGIDKPLIPMNLIPYGEGGEKMMAEFAAKVIKRAREKLKKE